MDYEIQREQFNRVLKSYMDYCALYKLINHGELEGMSDFAEFYLRFTYRVKYYAQNGISALGN